MLVPFIIQKISHACMHGVVPAVINNLIAGEDRSLLGLVNGLIGSTVNLGTVVGEEQY